MKRTKSFHQPQHREPTVMQINQKLRNPSEKFRIPPQNTQKVPIQNPKRFGISRIKMVGIDMNKNPYGFKHDHKIHYVTKINKKT